MNDSKRHIISVTSKLFLQKSYKEVTLKEIVEKTGLSKGGFYHYFTGKEQLFMEVLDYFFAEVFVHNYDSYSKDSFFNFYHDYAEAVKKAGKNYSDKTPGEKDLIFDMNYFSLIFDALKLFPEFRTQMITGFHKEIEIWAGKIGQARKNGEISTSLSDKEIAEMYISMSDGIAIHMIATGSSVEETSNRFLFLWDKFYEQIKSK